MAENFFPSKEFTYWSIKKLAAVIYFPIWRNALIDILNYLPSIYLEFDSDSTRPKDCLGRIEFTLLAEVIVPKNIDLLN